MSAFEVLARSVCASNGVIPKLRECDVVCTICKEEVQRFLAALESRGLKIVPVQATDGMCTALQWAESLDIDPGKWWTAALAFAPSVTLE